jgi:hypothetical protein
MAGRYIFVSQKDVMITTSYELQRQIDSIQAAIENVLEPYARKCEIRLKRIVVNFYVFDIHCADAIDVDTLEKLIEIVNKYKYFRTYEYKYKHIFRIAFDFNL